MASETVTPDHCTTEHVEKKVNEEVKADDQEIVAPSKENGGAVVEEKPKTEDLASPEAPVTESEEKAEDKPVDPPVVVVVEKVDDVPVLDVQDVDVQKVIEDCNPEPDVSAVPVPAIEVKEPQEESKLSDAPDVSAVPVPVIEVVEKEPEEESKLSDAPVAAAAVETVDKLEEVPPTPEPEKSPELDCKIEQSQSVAKVEEKAELPEVIKEVEEKNELIEPKESSVVEIAKDEDKSQEDTNLSEEKVCIDQERVASESVDAVIATNQEAPSDPKDGEECDIPDIVKTTEIDVGTVEEMKLPETTKTEDVSDVVEKLATEASLDEGKVDEQKEEKDVKVDTEEKNGAVEEVKQPETTKNEVASVSNSATEVTKNSFEGEKASRDVEVVPEEKKEECVRGDVDTSAKTSKDTDVEEKQDVADTTTTTTTVNEPAVEEPKELVSEEKAKDTVELLADKLDKAAEAVDEIAKTDAPNLESSKEVTDTKKEEDLPKQEVPPKAKHSNNIISKVKQSIVKVKKAIIGKSPSSKTISTDAKDEVKVK